MAPGYYIPGFNNQIGGYASYYVAAPQQQLSLEDWRQQQLERIAQYQQQQQQQNNQELQISLNGQQSGTQTNPTSSATYNSYINDISDDFYQSIKGAGTDDELFESTLNKVNKDNIMDVIKKYNKYHSKETGKSFIDAFLDDASSAQLREYLPKLSEALRDKAEELDIWDEEMAEAFAVIDDETQTSGWASFWCGTDEEKVSEAFQTIIDKIADAEARQIAEEAAEDEVDDEDKQPIIDKVYAEEMEYTKPYDAMA